MPEQTGKSGRALRRKLKSAAGTSLVEMLVCTILFSLAFMAGISGLLFAYNSTTDVMSAADAQKVSDTILNRIGGELAGMAREDDVRMDDSGSIIAFTSGSGIPVYICTEKVEDITSESNGLVVFYHKTKIDGTNTDASTEIPQSRWTFDDGSYRGYTVQNISFEAGDHNGVLTVKTKLVLKSPKGKEYSTERTVCCYNRENAGVLVENLADIVNGTYLSD